MRTIKLFFVIIVIITFIPSLILGQDLSNANSDWRVASYLEGKENGKKTYDIFYDANVSVKDSVIFLNVIKIYTEYGEKCDSTQRSIDTGSPIYSQLLTLGVKENKLAFIRIFNTYEDKTTFLFHSPENYCFLIPDEGSLGKEYLRLVKRSLILKNKKNSGK